MEGWKVITVWECEVLNDTEEMLHRVVKELKGGREELDKMDYRNLDIGKATRIAELRHKYLLNEKAGPERFTDEKKS